MCLLERSLSDLTIIIFNAFALMFLNESQKGLDYRRDFNIYDENDKIGLTEEILI
ncbi:hypothetical protein [Borrelia sp. RT1S]|uniref:hypothetical protein n=1 Tax=Borrelia sp. RT1S TaxID=2898580 RepID=UPI001E46116C|nr:hypothetical protein [Borrelia sp. RT1S]UGQ17392.1 hypothetical protein LSO05_03125 [Borrelia sp. RT1S]